MEEKKLDKSSLIGMGLLAGLLFWMVSGNFGKEDEKLEDEKQKTEKVDTTEMAVAEIFNAPPTDSLATEKFKAALGDFAYSATLPAAYDEEVVVDDEVAGIVVQAGIMAQLVVDQADDVLDLRHNRLQQFLGPLFQSLTHNGVVGVGEGLPCNLKAVVEVHTLLHQQADQLRNGHCRVGIV